MNKIAYLTPFALLTLMAPPSSADTHRRHGSTCAPKHSSNALVGADERGMYNASTSAAATITCAAPDRRSRYIQTYNSNENGRQDLAYTQHVAPTVEGIRINGRDLSTTSPFSCYLFWTVEDGFSSWGPTKYGCSTSGGCNDSTTEYTGMVTISWSTSTTLPINDDDYVGVVCTLPPTTAAGSSYVKGVWLNDSVEVKTWYDRNEEGGFAVPVYDFSWY